MKKFIFLWSIVLITGLIFASCGGGNAEHKDHMNHDSENTEHSIKEGEAQKGAEFTSAYVCPMHCAGSGSEEPGNCPVCGMDYVAKADHEAKKHTH